MSKKTLFFFFLTAVFFWSIGLGMGSPSQDAAKEQLWLDLSKTNDDLIELAAGQVNNCRDILNYVSGGDLVGVEKGTIKIEALNEEILRKQSQKVEISKKLGL